MDLRKLIFTKNDCYKAGRTITPKGIMVHSTGANNPKLSRYVGPDDGLLGKNPNNNHWNQGGITKCVHAFIGLDKDKKVATYQTLPWNRRGWHGGGRANDTHISFEICEDGLKDATYFGKVYKEAVELCAYLCKMYGWNEKVIIDHSEGHKKGIASNHGDVMHWFPKHGKSMNTFRADVKKLLTASKPVATKPTTPAKPTTTAKPTTKKTIDQLAKEVIDGKHGTGAAREKSLGSQYKAVQARVNELTQKAAKPKAKTINELAKEVIAGKHGTGRERMISLGDKFDAVQKEVNRILKSK